MSLFRLPEYPDEVFPRSPLKNVVCQVRFDEILSIRREPLEFQERIRSLFPRFSRQQLAQIAWGEEEIVPAATARLRWQFRTHDNSDILSLVTDSLSVETNRYVDFPTFRSGLDRALTILQRVYAPPVFTRVGVRYINEVIRWSPDDHRPDWKGWINPDLIPAITLDASDDTLQSSAHQFTSRRPNGTMTLRCGLTRGMFQGKLAESLVWDMDYYTDQETDPSGVLALVAEYHHWIYRFFRYAVGDELLRRIRLPQREPDDDTIYGNATI
jgi:uncharacterized protein (TIGR04255 family)